MMALFLHSCQDSLWGGFVKGGRYRIKDREDAPSKDNLQISLFERIEYKENGATGILVEDNPSDTIKMLTPRYEADDKGNEDGGEGYGEAFLALLCLTNNTVVSNTW